MIPRCPAQEPVDSGRVLIVDDESAMAFVLGALFQSHGYVVRSAASCAEARRHIDSQPFDLALVDLRLPDGSGLDLITALRESSPGTQAILITGFGSIDIAIDSIKKGAFYYLEKPFTDDQILMLSQRALEFGSMKRSNAALKRALVGEDEFGMVGSTPKMRRIYETIHATARSDASVLIEGESGTGKELVATAIHRRSERANRTFVRINCAAIPKDLIESELFGYKKGAFTGADKDKRGLLEVASGGTLLLDEVAEMPIHLQTKLLRVLQERNVRRLGDEREVAVDFRLVAATNRDTAQAMRDGALREDLYFRISTIKITVPSLRERLDDLPLLAERFLARYSAKYGKVIKRISEEALELLSQHEWPGNVRELESVIERAVLFCQAHEIGRDCLPEHIRPAEHSSLRCRIPPFITLEEVEREVIEQTLTRTGGNVKKTAQILNLNRPTLYRKLRKFGLKRDAQGTPSGDDSRPSPRRTLAARPN
ncbi:MAG TPA: sigma-54 dependent transcriptional regulator [Blastocatellia bacterium]|nr:sigma-54 dependent transcriptional regulator [Blastocatellia bacterium]